MDETETPRIPVDEANIPLAGLLKSHPETAMDHLEFRFIAAGMSAYMAAERATEEERQRIAQAFRVVAAAADTDDPDDPDRECQADREFHLAIYDASHNAVMQHVMHNIFSLLHQDVFYDRSHFRAREGVRELLFRQHKAIHDAILAGDGESARRAAERHVLYIRDSLIESRVAEQRSAVARRRLAHADLAQRAAGDS